MTPKAIGRQTELRLTDFLKDQEPGLEISEHHNLSLGRSLISYNDIFTTLRALPISRQEELLVSFYTQKVENFPNGEKLAQFLTKLNNIPWFHPSETPDPWGDKIQKQSDQFYQRLYRRLLPIRVILENWGEAEQAEGQVELGNPHKPGRNAAIATGRFNAWDEAFTAPWTGLEDLVKNNAKYSDRLASKTVYYASWCAAWITVEDLVPKEEGQDMSNPFMPLFEGIFDKGYVFIGPIKGESVIFIPEKPKNRQIN